MCHRLTLTERLIHGSADCAVAVDDDDWEMGRLVLDPSFRAGPDLLRHCMYMALSYLDEQRRVCGLHAACTPMLARLYRRLGFEVVASEVPLARTAKTYTLIHGPFQRVFDALALGQ
ncbi:MAG: N-acetyltransferase [Rubrivivax sp.]|nr:MAG: N-acetyltransferase [Rubrivivax sp.]